MSGYCCVILNIKENSLALESKLFESWGCLF